MDRYEASAHAWQSLGPSFDRVALRKPNFSSKPIVYISGTDSRVLHIVAVGISKHFLASNYITFEIVDLDSR